MVDGPRLEVFSIKNLWTELALPSCFNLITCQNKQTKSDQGDDEIYLPWATKVSSFCQEWKESNTN